MKAKNTGVIILLSLLAVSCRLDPIFFIIASETAPKKPRIEGAPTNMVVFERDYPDPTLEDPDNIKTVPILYVASGRLHWYAKATDTNKPRWDSGEYSIDQPGGKIIALAATREYLYALCLTGSGISSTLRRIGRSDIKWEPVASPTGSYSLIQSIHADRENSYLFAGARSSRDASLYALLYLDNNVKPPVLHALREGTSILSGAVCQGDNYYLSTRGDGIFQIPKDNLARNEIDPRQLDESVDEETSMRNNRMFMGMIKLENGDIIAVERNGGALYRIRSDRPDSFERMYYTAPSNTGGISTGKYAIGALALWEAYNDDAKKLLVTSIQGGLYSTSISSYTHGYVEFILKLDGSFNTEETRRDPGRLQSLTDGNQDRYTASIGKHPINHLFQAPKEIDENMTFFASTQTNGLWSYRDRPDNGGWQWNAED